MRTRHNEGLAPPRNTSVTPDLTRGDEDGGEAGSDTPVRSCILTRDRNSRAGLVRLALSPDGEIFPDVRAKAPGRGAWIGVTRAELEAAYARNRLRGALSRAFKTGEFTLAPDLPALVAAALERNALDRLGLEARSGTLLTGTDKIETAARQGQLHALFHAADAGEDGMRKLAQAWRVGSDREGSELKGLVLPVARPTLSLALGRENVVHIALTDRAAGKRVSEALDRWLHFIGTDTLLASRGSAPQDASAARSHGLPQAATTHEELE